MKHIPTSQSNSPENPVDWVIEYSGLIPHGGQVLDVACGRGRNTRFLLDKGYSVVALDIDMSGLSDLKNHPSLEIITADLEGGSPAPIFHRPFAGIVVTNYLHRPLFADLSRALAEGGVLIYQTFMQGNEEFGRPRNPDFLLKENELEEVFGSSLEVVAFEQGYTETPKPAMVQKICALKKEIK